MQQITFRDVFHSLLMIRFLTLLKYFLQVLILMTILSFSLAPMPPCSPFILMNKVVESTNLLSDIHPYYPIPPCPYSGPLEALLKGDYDSVMIKDIPRHLWYELSWLLAVGLPRKWRVVSGDYHIEVNTRILGEGYTHSTRHPRTHQLGHNTARNPGIFHHQPSYDRIVTNNFRSARQALANIFR